MRQAEKVAAFVLRLGVVAVLAMRALAAPPAPPDPWATVAPAPTGWYSDKDDFEKKLLASKEANARTFDRQEKINAQSTDRLKALDPMELQSRMQTFMMEHPDEAMKVLQRTQTAGANLTDVQLKGEETRQSLETELHDLQARYKAALESARAPIDVKFKELDVRAQKDLVTLGESWVYAPWAVKEYDGLVAQWNAASVKVFGEWWSASGPFQGWLKRYREHLTADQIPSWEEADDAAAGLMVHLVDTPEASYKSTATLRAVGEYIRQVTRVYADRERRPKRMMSETP